MERHPAGKRLGVVPVDEQTDFETFAAKVTGLALDNAALLLRKHRDYGPKNIALAPGGALNGLRVRMHDKLARINHLLDSGAEAENESIYDSFLDLANYALIGQLVLDGEWPNE
jgi:hypothetical protein